MTAALSLRCAARTAGASAMPSSRLPVASSILRATELSKSPTSSFWATQKPVAMQILARSSAPTSAYHVPARSFQTSARAASKESWAAKGDISYNEVKKLASEPTGEVTIIDVREPEEVSAGMIPSAVNVPLSQFEKAFNPNGGADFQEKFAFPRPEFDSPIVFYCRSGKRSAQAQELAHRNGWRNSRNYKGSYLDWVSHEERS